MKDEFSISAATAAAAHLRSRLTLEGALPAVLCTTWPHCSGDRMAFLDIFVHCVSCGCCKKEWGAIAVTLRQHYSSNQSAQAECRDVECMTISLSLKRPAKDFPHHAGYTWYTWKQDHFCCHPSQSTETGTLCAVVFRARLMALRRWLWARPERCIALVAHAGM